MFGFKRDSHYLWKHDDCTYSWRTYFARVERVPDELFQLLFSPGVGAQLFVNIRQKHEHFLSNRNKQLAIDI